MNSNKQWGDLLTLKDSFVSHLTWATSVPILVLQGLSFWYWTQCTRQRERERLKTCMGALCPLHRGVAQ